MLLFCNTISNSVNAIVQCTLLIHKHTSYYPRSSTDTRDSYNLTLSFVVFRVVQGSSVQVVVFNSSYYRRFLIKMQGGYHDTFDLIVQQYLQQKILFDNQSMPILVKACWYTMFLVFLVLSHKMVMFLFSPHLDRATYSWPWENISESCNAMPETLTVWPGKKM